MELNEKYELIAPRFVRVNSLKNLVQRYCWLGCTVCSSPPDTSVLIYAFIDDQSNRSLATTYLLDLLDVNSEVVEYSLASCAGSFVFSGRLAEDCVVESLDGSTKMNLPALNAITFQM